ncbi:helix-turn-helix domain-containing protein [Kitasatospora viridis]|uniref:Helix-turn-helix protein n=1 Tax=Kitasatospora viridis TaxID=281105 RepID=A0A561UC26_9ACTN|nr:helix-turn-helix transcriptional regulator [Kitasatospora viridis]TWF96914.1 helix-turn-helix protein [Kitasatospora viridis]
MPSSPLSSVGAARKAIADQLVEIRKDAGLNGAELSSRCGWHPAKTSRIQSGKSAASEDDIRAWCTVCGAEDRIPDLIAATRAADSIHQRWRRRNSSGMRLAQEKVIGDYERTELFRIYVSNVLPGFFQTAEYATALMRSITDFQGTPNDVAAAVPARLARARLMHSGAHRFAVLIEEWVLRTRIGSVEGMAAQLDHLLALMSLPSVSIGIIPAGCPRAIWPLEAFYLFDDQRVAVETLTAKVNVLQPSEITDYVRAFAGLSKMAVHGAKARALIGSAIASLE